MIRSMIILNYYEFNLILKNTFFIALSSGHHKTIQFHWKGF